MFSVYKKWTCLKKAWKSWCKLEQLMLMNFFVKIQHKNYFIVLHAFFMSIVLCLVHFNNINNMLHNFDNNDIFYCMSIFLGKMESKRFYQVNVLHYYNLIQLDSICFVKCGHSLSAYVGFTSRNHVRIFKHGANNVFWFNMFWCVCINIKCFNFM